ncbi:MAG: PAS domain S-box protein, partial [bacterium]|nr:PAS domain S-box protein [bacterium]
MIDSEEKYSLIMKYMKDTVYITSKEFRIEYLNPRMIKRIGHDATGEYCYKAIYDSDEKCSWCVFDRVKAGECVDYELKNPRDNRIYTVTNTPLYHADGDISKLTVFRDITDSKAMELQLRQAYKMKAIGTLAGGIAHDFNNMLSIILGNTELAMDDVPEWNPARENLEEIKTGSLRAKDVV